MTRGLGDAFTSEVREAWAAAYSWLAFTMQRAAATSAIEMVCAAR
jgi:hemoglobin-like flavoprotein